MQAAGNNNLSSRQIADLEMLLSRQIDKRAKEAFADKEVVVLRGDGLYEKIDSVIQEIIKPFPATAAGSRFINATITVIPVLYVNLSHFHKLFQETAPGNLFLDEVGKAIDVGPLADPEMFGEYTFTSENVSLKVRNIRLKPGSDLQPNDAANQVPAQQDSIRINSKKIDGDVFTSPALKKTVFIADVAFGDILDEKDLEIPVETFGQESTTYLAIPLAKLSFTRKIYPDGTFHLPNREKCDVESLAGGRRVLLNCQYTFFERFPL